MTGSDNYEIPTFDHENRHQFYYGWNVVFGLSFNMMLLNIQILDSETSNTKTKYEINSR